MRTTHAARLTFSVAAASACAALITPRKVTYPSADGYTISAYLYEPTGLKPGEKAPGITYIDGGPTGQWVDSYNAQVQYFASRGYGCSCPTSVTVPATVARSRTQTTAVGAIATSRMWWPGRLSQAAALRQCRQDGDHWNQLWRLYDHVGGGIRARRLPGGDSRIRLRRLDPLPGFQQRDGTQSAARVRIRAAAGQ